MLTVCLLSQWWCASRIPAADRPHPARIGVLTAAWGPTPQVVGLRDGLLELGYREDEDFVLGIRFTQGELTALPTAARELVQYGVDMLIADEDAPARVLQRTTTQKPVVFLSVGDPIGLGLIQSFARPGGNITGVTDLSLDLVPKRLEVFRDLVPGLQRILFPYDAQHALSVAWAQASREAAHRLGMVLVERAVRTAAEAQAALLQVRRGEVDGLLQPPTPSLNLPGLILEASRREAIPAMFAGAFWTERGALASYGPDYRASGQQAARLVDKILKGANPTEIPVEVNNKIEFTINLKTAQALGLTIAPEVLFRADRVIR